MIVAEDIIKLTVRLPVRLHAALRRRAAQSRHSVNLEIVTTLSEGLDVFDSGKAGTRDAVAALLREQGLWVPQRQAVSADKSDRDRVAIDYASLRRSIGPVPSLSELIVEDRLAP